MSTEVLESYLLSLARLIFFKVLVVEFTSIPQQYHMTSWFAQSHIGKALLRVSGLRGQSDGHDMAHGEDWIILLGEQRLLSVLSEWRPAVTDGHLHFLSWLLSSSISEIPHLHVSLPQTAQRNNGSQGEEDRKWDSTATTSPPPSQSFYFHISILHFLPVNVWMPLMAQSDS